MLVDSLGHLLRVFPRSSRRLCRASAAHDVEARRLGREAGAPADRADLDGGHVHRHLDTHAHTEKQTEQQKKRREIP